MNRPIATLILALSAATLTAQPTDNREFELLVSQMKSMTSSQADSVARSLMTSAEDLTAIGNMARDLLFDVESDQFDEQLYGSFARAISDSPLASMTQKALAEWEVHAIELNAPGSKATDFKVKQIAGPTVNLSTLTTGKRSMIYFYNPDCRHCEATMEQLRDKQLPVTVFAVCVDALEKRWRDTCGALPEGWIPLFDATDVQAEDLYIFLSTPSVYLLDENGIVTEKNPTTEQILNLQ